MPKQLNPTQLEEYEKVSKYIDIILLSPETFNLLKFDREFQQVVEKDINIITYFETNYDVEEPKAPRFIQAFKMITGNEVQSIMTDEELSKDETITDVINYNDIFLMNLTGQNVYQIEESLKEAAVNHEQKTKAKEEKAEAKRVSDEQEQSKDPKKDESNQEDNNQAFVNNSNPYSQNPFMFNANMNGGGEGYPMNDIADQLIAQQASMLLNRNIAIGKVYAFKTKPKVIPVMRYLTIVFISLLLIFAIVAFAMIMTTNNKFTFQVTQQNGSTPVVPLGPLVSPFPYQLLMFFFIAALIIWSMVRNHKNENYKFHYSWGWMLFYILMIILVTFISSGANWSLVFHFSNFQSVLANPANGNLSFTSGPVVSINDLHKYLKPETAQAYSIIISWRILQFVIYSLIVAIIICLIIGAVYNPKRDLERLQQLVNSYADDIRNGTISSEDFGGGNMFGGPFSRMLF